MVMQDGHKDIEWFYNLIFFGFFIDFYTFLLILEFLAVFVTYTYTGLPKMNCGKTYYFSKFTSLYYLNVF